MQKRLRIFAGPNGSGKSSIIKSILNTEVEKGKKLDFGTYINADDIAKKLLSKGISLSSYKVDIDRSEFDEIINQSGLFSNDFSFNRFHKCLSIEKNKITINHVIAKSVDDNSYERIAQILADYLRKKLLKEGAKFSFETVFSHPGKLEFMKLAQDQGYKVYLYFVSTEDPNINIYRVKEVRVKQNGHDVEEGKIVSRYYRSMDQLHDAAQYCYQAYFFDNSQDGTEAHSMFAHFKLNAEGQKMWDDIEKESVPKWFVKYYSKKVEPKQ